MALTADQQSAQDYINNSDSGQGGLDKYTQTQQQRYNDAVASGNTDLVNRLQSDAQRVGYSLPTSTPTSGGNAPTAPTAPTSSSNPSLGTTATTPSSGGSGSSGGASSYVPSQSLPGYSYKNVNDPTFLAKDPNERLQAFKNDPNLALQELNRVKGVYGQTTDPTQQQNIHNWADQVRQAAGINSNDPFFGNGSDLQPQGQSHVNVNGQAKPDLNISFGNTFDTANKIADMLGVSYQRDPKTGNVIIGGKEFPASYVKDGQAYVPARLVAEALGYKVEYNQSTNTATITGGKPVGNQLPQQATGGGGGWLGSVLGSMPQAPQLQQYQDPNLSYYQNQMLPYSQFNPNMSSYYDQAKNQLDPQAQASYNQLMGKQNLDINHMNDSMNHRGIYTSGIAQAAENDLRAKTTSAIASIFTKEQSDIAKTAQSLYDSAYKQYLSGNQFALKNNSEMLQQMMAEKKQAFTQYIQSQHLTMDQANYALKAWDQMSSYIYKNAQMQMQDQHFQQQMQFKDFQFNNLSADQSANLQKNYDQMSQDWNKAMLPYQYQTANQQATTDIKQQALNASNYFKQMGINIDQSKLEEMIRHNQAGEQNSSDSNKLKLYDMMGFGPNGTPTMKRDQLDQTIAHDAQTVQIAKDNATTSANKSIVDGIGRQLSAINSQISAMYNQGNTIDQNALKSLSDKRDTYLNQLSQYTNQGFVGSNFPLASP